MERGEDLLVNDYKSNVAERTLANVFGETFVKKESDFSYNEREDFRVFSSYTISTGAWNNTSSRTVIERKIEENSFLWKSVYEIEIYTQEAVYSSYASRPVFAEIRFGTEYGNRPNERYFLIFFDLEPFHEVVSWIRDNVVLGRKIDDWNFLFGLSFKEGVRANVEAI